LDVVATIFDLDALPGHHRRIARREVGILAAGHPQRVPAGELLADIRRGESDPGPEHDAHPAKHRGFDDRNDLHDPLWLEQRSLSLVRRDRTTGLCHLTGHSCGHAALVPREGALVKRVDEIPGDGLLMDIPAGLVDERSEKEPTRIRELVEARHLIADVRI